MEKEREKLQPKLNIFNETKFIHQNEIMLLILYNYFKGLHFLLPLSNEFTSSYFSSFDEAE